VLNKADNFLKTIPSLPDVLICKNKSRFSFSVIARGKILIVGPKFNVDNF